MKYNLNYLFLFLIFAIKKTNQTKHAIVNYLEENSLNDPTSNELLFFISIYKYENSRIFIKIKDSNSFTDLTFKYSFVSDIESYEPTELIELSNSQKGNEYKFKLKNDLKSEYLALLITSKNNFEKNVTVKSDSAINNLRAGKLLQL